MAYLDDLIHEFNNSQLKGVPIDQAIEQFNLDTTGEFIPISEAEYNKKVEHLRLEILDVDKFIKTNDCKAVTNPVFYNANGAPTSDGLLSYELFGITKQDRAGLFGYIDLKGWFIHPSCYKQWCRIDRNIKRVVHKDGLFEITPKGEIVESENGHNGVEWLKKNIDKIKFKNSDSFARDLRVKFLEKNRNKMFINKYPVIPAYYRDTNTGKRSVGVGGVNKIYSQLIIAVNSLSSTQEFGFDMSGAIEGRVQEILVALYEWFVGKETDTVKTDVGTGIMGKSGILKHTNMSKTSNYAAKLVITGPDVKTNRVEDMRVDFDTASIPLAAAIACFRPFVQYNVRAFFEREFLGTELYPVLGVDGKVEYKRVIDPLIEFSDERITKELNSFLHAYNNRLVPIEIPIEGTPKGKKYYLQFQGYFKDENNSQQSIYKRRLTWCDIFFMAACEAVTNRMILITRYPIDSRYNQIACKPDVASTNLTEPMTVNGTFYKYYPKITEDMIGSNTGNMFVDTLSMSNLYLPGNGGDYDGDTVTVTGAFLDETNEELRNFVNSKYNFIDLGSNNIRSSSADVINSIYSLTRVLNGDDKQLSQPTFN